MCDNRLRKSNELRKNMEIVIDAQDEVQNFRGLIGIDVIEK